MLPLIFFLVLACHHPGSSFSGAMAVNHPKVHFYYNSPIYPSVYRVIRGSLTGIQKTFHDRNHDTIVKGDEFTVVVDFGLPLYNKERKWYEIAARFCYGKDIKECLQRDQHPFGHPYFIRPSSVQIPVPFVIPFSKIHNVTLPDGSTVLDAGTVHEQFKTFEVNGAKYDASTGILMSFSAVSPEKAGKISDITFSRDTGKILKYQPLVQCYYVEWTTDGCVPGLDNLMTGYDVKLLELKYRRWLKAVNFPNHRDERYLQNLYLGSGQKDYLVFKDMTLKKVSPFTNPFFHLFLSVEDQIKTNLKSVGLGLDHSSPAKFVASGKYESISKHYEQQSSSAAMSGTEFRFFHASMSNYYLVDEENWDDSFKTKLKNFLLQRNKGNALNFFREYGTHYIVDAVMGGRQEAVFTVNYCQLSKNKSTEASFKAFLEKPYISNEVNVHAYYNNMTSHLFKKIIISGPQTKCTGGISLDLDVCHDLSLWRSTVLINPYPIRMTLRPFYNLVKDDQERLWMKRMYEEYLEAGVDEVKINTYIKMKATCQKNPAFPKSSGLSDGEISAIVFGTIFGIVIMIVVVGLKKGWFKSLKVDGAPCHCPRSPCSLFFTRQQDDDERPHNDTEQNSESS